MSEEEETLGANMAASGRGGGQSEEEVAAQQACLTGSQLQDLDEELAECIAVWEEGSGAPDYNAKVQQEQQRQQSPRRPASSHSIEAVLPSSGPVLCVNVGGMVYRATASTLRRAPFFDSLLRHASEEGGLGTTVDDAGRLFVDRSGDLFSYILEFLRSGHWLLRDRASDLEFLSALKDEAHFYGLESRECTLLPQVSEYVTVWQFRNDTSLYVDCLEQTVRQDPDHQGLFRLCKYTGGLQLDQQTCTKRFKATSHSLQSVIAYFAMRGFSLQHVVEGSMITHTTSADGQIRTGCGTQYILSRRLIPLAANSIQRGDRQGN